MILRRVFPTSFTVLLACIAFRGAIAQPDSAQADTAQQPPRTTGSIVGVVTDSLRNRPMGDGVVTVLELPTRSALTSGTGEFHIDSLPAGQYTLELSHALLDSLGVRLVSLPVVVTAGEQARVTMGIPSAQTIVANMCTPLHQKLGPGILLGRVLEADSGKPMAGAEVSVAWMETTVDPVRGVETGPRVRRDTVNTDGSFRLCGVPAGLRGTILATSDNSRTGELSFDAGEGVLVSIRSLMLSSKPQTLVATPVRDSALQGSATVTGRVTNRGGVPIEGARVVVLGSVAETTTRTDGTFTMTNVPAGSQMIAARKVGYSAAQLPVDVSNRAPATVTLALGEAPSVQLDPVEVKERRKALAGTGFDRRRKRGDGRYITEEMLDKLRPIYISDALRRLPGLYILGSGARAQLYSSRGNGCVNFLIDNQPMNNQGVGQQSVDELIRPEDVLGIEFYQAGQVPMVLQRSRTSGCSLLVVWTRASVKESAR